MLLTEPTTWQKKMEADFVLIGAKWIKSWQVSLLVSVSLPAGQSGHPRSVFDFKLFTNQLVPLLEYRVNIIKQNDKLDCSVVDLAAQGSSFVRQGRILAIEGLKSESIAMFCKITWFHAINTFEKSALSSLSIQVKTWKTSKVTWYFSAVAMMPYITGWICKHLILFIFLSYCILIILLQKNEDLDNNLASVQSTNKKPLVKLACLYVLWKGFQTPFDVAPRHWSSLIMWFLFTHKSLHKCVPDDGSVAFSYPAIINTLQKA